MIKNILLYAGSIITLIMASSLLYSAFVFTYYPKKMQEFCEFTAIGESIEESKKKADINNFKYHLNRESKTLMVHDTKTMGKSTCTISYKDNGQVYKKSYVND